MGDLLDFIRTHTHSDDPSTSAQAAANVFEAAKNHREKILAALRLSSGPMTFEEIANVLGLKDIQVLKRLTDLYQDGIIDRIDDYKKVSSGGGACGYFIPKGALPNQRHALKDRGDDLYQTPPEAVHALVKAENLPHNIWEPACGPGSIMQTLEGLGHRVWGSDLVDYGQPGLVGVDFLMETKAPFGINCIVTNPPFKLAEQFVEKALELCPQVIMLLRLAFLTSEKRTNILEHSGLARVHVFRKRLPMMHREGWEGPKASSSMDFAWFVWDRTYYGPTILNRISWDKSE